jgi:hypothetical protein
VETEEDEGWYTDPYGRHEARWMSMGRPTGLVRDAGVESHEDPPDSPPSHRAERVGPPQGSMTAADTLRADDAESESPTMTQIDDAARNFVLSGWRGPFGGRSHAASLRKAYSWFHK